MAIPKIIAIDGPAASGKSTLAEKLAIHYGYLFFDTGIMYRAVTWAALQKLKGVTCEELVTQIAQTIAIDIKPASIDDGRKVDVFMDGEDITWKIRTPEVDENVSFVSAFPGVRKAMTEQQRKIALRGSVVIVGRDIGTVVCPEADIKIYLDASTEERARRRYVELDSNDSTVSYENILNSMIKRDKIDSTRAVAPLKIAEDAIVVSTDGLNLESVYDRVVNIINMHKEK